MDVIINLIILILINNTITINTVILTTITLNPTTKEIKKITGTSSKDSGLRTKHLHRKDLVRTIMGIGNRKIGPKVKENKRLALLISPRFNSWRITKVLKLLPSLLRILTLR